MLVLSVAKNLDELFEDCGLAAVTPLGKLSRIVEMTVHLFFVLVVGVLRTEHRRTYRAGKVLNVIFAIESGNIGAAQRATTFVTK